MIKRKTKDGRYLEFVFNENELISYLCEFSKWSTNQKVTEEERELIAEFVMMG